MIPLEESTVGAQKDVALIQARNPLEIQRFPRFEREAHSPKCLEDVRTKTLKHATHAKVAFMFLVSAEQVQADMLRVDALRYYIQDETTDTRNSSWVNRVSIGPNEMRVIGKQREVGAGNGRLQVDCDPRRRV